MSASELRLREAGPADRRFVWETNNHPSARAQAIRPADIPWDDHVRWFDASLGRANRSIWIVEDGGEPVGVVRVDIAQGAATIGIALSPASRGRGLGRAAIRAGSTAALARPGVDVVLAFVRPSNEPSRRAFTAAGYELAGRETQEGVELERYERRDQAE